MWTRSENACKIIGVISPTILRHNSLTSWLDRLALSRIGLQIRPQFPDQGSTIKCLSKYHKKLKRVPHSLQNILSRHHPPFRTLAAVSFLSGRRGTNGEIGFREGTCIARDMGQPETDMYFYKG